MGKCILTILFTSSIIFTKAQTNSLDCSWIRDNYYKIERMIPQKFVNIYEANAPDFQKAHIRIYHNERYPSSIILPVN